jgi:predicted SAM-dependent methyltransferase
LSKLLNLNLGCGNQKIPGFIGADKFGNPDVVHDLEQFPWPWDDNSVASVIMSHVLEHLGRDTATYFGIIKELYRICVHNADILIKVPHPRHDDFLGDPTHVRPILPEGLALFSKRLNREWIRKNVANSTLGLHLDVDFEITESRTVLDPEWQVAIQNGEISQDEVLKAASRYANVIKESIIILRVMKNPTTSENNE